MKTGDRVVPTSQAIEAGLLSPGDIGTVEKRKASMRDYQIRVRVNGGMAVVWDQSWWRRDNRRRAPWRTG